MKHIRAQFSGYNSRGSIIFDGTVKRAAAATSEIWRKSLDETDQFITLIHCFLWSAWNIWGYHANIRNKFKAAPIFEQKICDLSSHIHWQNASRATPFMDDGHVTSIFRVYFYARLHAILACIPPETL